MDEVHVTGRERIRAAFAHRESDRVPVFEQSVASDVASEILSREAFTGTTYLHYQEAVAWMQGEQAHQEFEERLQRDVIDLSLALGFDMLHPPWRLTQLSRGAPQSPDELEPLVAQSEQHAEEYAIPDPAAAYPWQAKMLEEFGQSHEVTGGCGLGIPDAGSAYRWTPSG